MLGTSSIVNHVPYPVPSDRRDRRPNKPRRNSTQLRTLNPSSSVSK